MANIGIILARAGSKGIPHKCVVPLAGRPMILFTFDHARASTLLDEIILSTDSDEALRLAEEAGITTLRRPNELATDTATVDAAARHAVRWWETQPGRDGRSSCSADRIVLLYANIPVRAPGIVDRTLQHLVDTGADSVRTVAPVGKHHPDWLHRLNDDRMSQFRTNSIYRRQDLEPLYYHDGAVVAVTRSALFQAETTPEDKQSFLGQDRRALIQKPEDAVDVDEPVDLLVAEAMLRHHDQLNREHSAHAGA